VIRIQTTTCNGVDTGTGILIGPRLIATVEHVVDGGASIELVRNGRVLGYGTVIGSDPARDVALVRSDSPITGYRFKFASQAPLLGQDVAAIGFPLGLPLTVTRGSVSGLDRTIPIDGINRARLVQTDAPVNPGNSGGPLMTDSGQVVGLVDLGTNQANGLAFAVSADVAGPLIQSWGASPQPLPNQTCGAVAAPLPAPPTSPASGGSDSLAGERAAVVDVLDQYQQAFSNHDAAGLAAILAPGITRYGVVPGGCGTLTGRDAVLRDYEAQFPLVSGYQLVGLSPGQVQLSDGTAQVSVRYQITGGSSGNIQFDLNDTSGGWQISEIIADCHP
jgi:S1-C subfamily serine protease